MKPIATGPITFENDGAMPSQLNSRTRSVASVAVRPAVRWMVSMPMLAPEPVSIAATHSTAKCGQPWISVDSTASSTPVAVSPTAM
jgi:hypothetical protein